MPDLFKGNTYYLVRHGEAEHNVLHVASSYPEITERHLTERGKRQIHEVAAALAKYQIECIISSPLVRTRETAAIIAEAIGGAVLIDDRLQEAGFGIYNDRPIEYFFQKYNTPESRLSTDANDDVESFLDMRARLTRLLHDITARYTGKNIVLVSHGDPLEQLHGILLNEAPGVSATGWYPPQGSCFVLDAERGCRPIVSEGRLA